MRAEGRRGAALRSGVFLRATAEEPANLVQKSWVIRGAVLWGPFPRPSDPNRQIPAEATAPIHMFHLPRFDALLPD